MPLLDVSVAQPCLPSYGMKLQSQRQGSGLKYLTFTGGKGFRCTWQKFGIPNRFCKLEFIDNGRSVLIIKAVATLENMSAVRGEKWHENIGSEVNNQLQISSEDSKELEEREKLRRMRISKANKGNTPWNKGRKHSAETLKRIKERTRLAMQDPKVKMKLVNQGHAQSEETKMKIAVGVRAGWERRRQKLLLQEMCHFEWQNLIAEASRIGFSGEEELMWDSYQKLDEQLEQDWVETVDQRKKSPRVKGSRRAPKSIEQRRKIAEAISAKWSDPDYRNRVCSALAKFHGTIEKKPRRIPRDPAQTRNKSVAKKATKDTLSLNDGDLKILSARAKLKKINVPKYKDPMASSKLEMIKNIRAQRAAADTNKTAAINRARLMIAEAEKAAKALEATASTNPNSMASLIETRKLINEAIQSIQSIDATLVTSLSLDSTEQSSEDSYELGHLVAKENDMVNTDTNNVNGAGIKINGTHVHSLADENNSHFTRHAFLDDEVEVLPMISNGYASAPHLNSSDHFNKQCQQPVSSQTIKCHDSESSNGALSHVREQIAPSNPASNKRWVRGRLVEMDEEEEEID